MEGSCGRLRTSSRSMSEDDAEDDEGADLKPDGKFGHRGAFRRVQTKRCKSLRLNLCTWC